MIGPQIIHSVFHIPNGELNEIDLAIVWGPLAGYFAKHERVPLAVVPVSPQVDQPFLPFVYDIAMGVRKQDGALKARLDDIIARNEPAIRALLESYGVPLAKTS